MLTQNTNGSGIAIDKTGNASYSDMIWDTNLVKLNNLTSANWRFYLNIISNFSSYQSNFNLIHTYALTGLYDISIMFPSSNLSFKYSITVTDCKLN